MEGINMSLKPIDPKTLELNPFTTIGTEWMLLTAGNEDKHNTMTVSWGGLGVLWRKNVTYVLVRPQRYTMEFMDREEYYSLCVFDETYKPALKLCGTKSGRDIDKDKETGLTVMFDQEAPYYAEAKLVFICKKLCHFSIFFYKSTESCRFHILVRLMCRIKFHDRMIFIVDSETDHALSTVYIIAPDRNSLLSGNAWKKACKRALFSIVFN